MAASQQDAPQDLAKDLVARYNAATAGYMAGHFAAAEQEFKQLVSLDQRTKGPEHSNTLACRTMQAMSLFNLGRYKEAEVILRDVLQIRQQNPEFGVEHPDTLEAVKFLGDCLRLQGRWNEAEPMLRKVHSTQVRLFGPLDLDSLSMQALLACCIMEDKQLEEAERLLRHALEEYQKMEGLGHHHVPSTQMRLAKCLEKGQNYAESETLCRQAVKYTRRNLGEQNPLTLNALTQHADVLGLLGWHADAEVEYKLAYQGSKALLGMHHYSTLQVLNKLDKCFEKQGKMEGRDALLGEMANQIALDMGGTGGGIIGRARLHRNANKDKKRGKK